MSLPGSVAHIRCSTRGRSGRPRVPLDLREITSSTGVTVDDVAKRLIDYGFHAPTMSFPWPAPWWSNPPSEDLRELDRFCDAMIAIRSEIDEVGSGAVAIGDSVLRNAPHTARCLVDEWDRPTPGGLRCSRGRRRQVLAAHASHRQRLRRPEPALHVRPGERLLLKAPRHGEPRGSGRYRRGGDHRGDPRRDLPQPRVVLGDPTDPCRDRGGVGAVRPAGPRRSEFVLVVILAPLVFGEALTVRSWTCGESEPSGTGPGGGTGRGGCLGRRCGCAVVVPGIWTSMAFALGAILSPTDAVAVSATARKAEPAQALGEHPGR